jgi:hypothetical protein
VLPVPLRLLHDLQFRPGLGVHLGIAPDVQPLLLRLELAMPLACLLKG